MPPTQKKQKVAVKKEYKAETDDEKEKEEHDDQKQKVAMKKEYEAETDDEKEKEEHDNQKQKVAMKKEYEAETDDEEEEEKHDDYTSEPNSDDSESSKDTAAKEEYERARKEHEKKWTEKWECLKESRLKDIAKRKKELDAGKREKVTYVWHLCTKHSEKYERCSSSFGVGKRGFLIVLKKESYELWHKILLNLKNCQTWSDVRDLGDDVYAAVHERAKYISSFDINSEEDEEAFSPNDSDGFDMAQVDVFGDSDYDNIVALQHFPIAITHLMYDDLPGWMHGQYDDLSLPALVVPFDSFQFDPKDVDYLLEDIILGGDSIEHQPGLEDFLEDLLKWADLDAVKRKKVTYVWHLCKEHPNEDWRPSQEGGVLLILTKESYELWHKILLNLKNCQTWSDVRDLGDDVYAEVLDRGKYIWEYSEEDEKKRKQDFSPNDSDEFNMIQVDVLSEGYGSYDDIDMQNQSFPNDISKLMFDDLESTFLCKYNKFSSSFPWNCDLFNFDPKDADSLLEEITQRGDSIMHQPGLEDFMWHGLQAIS